MDSTGGRRVGGCLAVAIGCEVSDVEAKVAERHGWCDAVEEGCCINSRVDARYSGVNVADLWISFLGPRRFWGGFFDIRRSSVDVLIIFGFFYHLRGDLIVHPSVYI